MTDPVERVAAAIAHAAGLNSVDIDRDVVRAAIAAMPGEPVAYVPLDGDRPLWSEVHPRKLRDGDVPLYAAPAMPATDAAREALGLLETDLTSIFVTIGRFDRTLQTELLQQLCKRGLAQVDKIAAALSHPSQGGWQPIDGYEVSHEGSVRASNGRVLKQWKNTGGYMLVRLNQPRRVERVHRLVARAFIPNPDNKPFVNHIDCNPENNAAHNLEWCTQAENLAHSAGMGRMQREYWVGRRSPNAKLTDDEVRDMRRHHEVGGMSLAKLGKAFGVSKRCAGRVILREIYQDVWDLPAPPEVQP